MGKNALPTMFAEVPYDQAPENVKRYMKKHGMDKITGHVGSNGDDITVRVFFGVNIDSEPAVFARDSLQITGTGNSMMKQILASIPQSASKCNCKKSLD